MDINTITIQVPKYLNQQNFEITVKKVLQNHRLTISIVQVGKDDQNYHYELTGSSLSLFHAGIATAACLQAHHFKK